VAVYNLGRRNQGGRSLRVSRFVLSGALALLAAACGESSAPSSAAEPAASIEQAGPPATAPLVAGSTDAASPVPSEAASAPAAPGDRVELDGTFRTVMAAIASHRPGYRLHLTPDRLDGDWRLDGEVDDGFGAARLFVVLTVEPGMLTAHP
jgi:hypothetical protein